MNTFLTRLRLAQIRLCARAIRSLSRVPPLFGMIKVLREVPLLRVLFIALVAFNRPFPLLEQASASIVRFRRPSHEDANHVKHLMALAESARPSDYAALFHIRSVLSQTRNIFDFGGSAGNLFYCYARYLKLAPDTVWTVYDLPKNINAGAQLASQKNEKRLGFTDRFAAADGADLFIASGALHYFDKPLAGMLADFNEKPRYVLVNRTPMTDGPAFATVQDSSGLLVSCMLYNREEFVRSFEQIGYKLVDSWQVAELSLVVPGYPDRSAATYSGMFFKLHSRDQKLLRGGPAPASLAGRSGKRRAARKSRRRVGRIAARRSSSSGRK